MCSVCVWGLSVKQSYCSRAVLLFRGYPRSSLGRGTFLTGLLAHALIWGLSVEYGALTGGCQAPRLTEWAFRTFSMLRLSADRIEARHGKGGKWPEGGGLCLGRGEESFLVAFLGKLVLVRGEFA